MWNLRPQRQAAKCPMRALALIQILPFPPHEARPLRFVGYEVIRAKAAKRQAFCTKRTNLRQVLECGCEERAAAFPFLGRVSHCAASLVLIRVYSWLLAP